MNRHRQVVPLVLTSLLALAGCNGGDEATPEMGTIEIPLTASGSDGSTYHLPPGTQIAVWGISNPRFFDVLSIDGDTATAQHRLPVGTYIARVTVFGEVVTELDLQRYNADSTVEQAHGYLTTPMPADITIEHHEVTSLSITFAVPRAGNVTFGKGTLEVSLDVDEVPADGIAFQHSGTFTPFLVNVSSEIPPALAAILPDAGISELNFGLSADVIGPWVEANMATVCAPIRIGAASGDHIGLLSLLASETIDETNEACFTQLTGQVQLNLFMFHEFGPARSTTIGDALGTTPFFMSAVVASQLDPAVFDGETLDLESLTTFRIEPTDFALILLGDVEWYNASFDGDLLFGVRSLVNN